ncbi:MAG: ThuA domain-containing protein [Leadbetterella sp.]
MRKWLVFVSVFFCITLNVFAQKQFKVLLFTKTAGFHHESILDGVAAIKKLGERHFFDVDWHEKASIFNENDLKAYSAIIFLSTTGDILTEDQQKSMEAFIKSGKGFVGLHAATDTEYGWEWYEKMIGMMFKIHPTNQTAYLDVQKSDFPGMERWPKRMLWTDEWYEFSGQKSKDLTFLITIDEKSYNPEVSWGPEKKGKGMGDFHPIAWYQKYDGGRAFYTALGHIPAVYQEQLFLDHIYGGIYWAATGKGLK